MRRSILSILILIAGFVAISEHLGKKVSVPESDGDKLLESKYESHFHYEQPYYQNLMKIRSFTACGDTAMVVFNGNHEPISEFFRKRYASEPIYNQRPDW